MKNLLCGAVVLGLCLPAMPLAAADPVVPEGFTPLFNGKDFSGLRALGHYSPKKYKELGEKIKRALNALSPRYRTVLILRLFHGYSYKEIAEIMGASLNEVKIWIHRARNQMKDKFSSYFQPVWQPW